MTIIAKILDSRKEGDATCFLSTMTLEEYIKGLPDAYQEFDIQRGIVSNAYLDHLVETVVQNRHIPSIVLLVDDESKERKDGFLEISTFKILDGLQRTFRLQAIRQTIKYCLNNIQNGEELLAWSRVKFSREYSADLKRLQSNTGVLRVIVETQVEIGRDKLLETFSKNDQWFEIWKGLTPQQEVKKMLLLNAGHKPVALRHALELLFLNLLPFLEEGENDQFKLVREKEIGSAQFSKKRKVGDFHFAHVIGSLLSLYSGEPVTPTQDLIQDLQNDDDALEEYAEITTPDFLRGYVGFLLKLDELFAAQYGEAGTVWMGREVSLAGLFGAIGYVDKNSDKTAEQVMSDFLSLVEAHVGVMDLAGFEAARNSQDLSKINIGKVNRQAVFAAVKGLLLSEFEGQVDWNAQFKARQS